MSESLLLQNFQVKAEADDLLRRQGLLDLLGTFGTPHVSGSYALDLMTWRDLDIYLCVECLDAVDHFAIGQGIDGALSPLKMSYRNELRGRTKGLPAGRYWGIYMGNERAGAWKIDLWVVAAAECDRLLAYAEAIRRRLTPETRQRILAIKNHCWTDPAYRRSYNSSDIYSAVLDHGVLGIDGFRMYLEAR